MPASSSPPIRWLSYLLIAVGAAFFVVAVLTAMENWRFIQRSETAPGVVSRLLAGSSHPEIRFTTREGESITYAEGGFVFGYRAGEDVIVRYDPTAPRRRATVDTWPTTWSITIFLTVLALLMTIFGIWSLWNPARFYIRGIQS